MKRYSKHLFFSPGFQDMNSMTIRITTTKISDISFRFILCPRLNGFDKKNFFFISEFQDFSNLERKGKRCCLE